MEHYTPTFDASSTISGVAEFVKKNESEVWKTFLPIMPFVFISFLLDYIVNDIIYAGSTVDLVFGEYIAEYFFACMAISWHRIVIKGTDNYIRVNAFKPKKDELIFIGVWMLFNIVPKVALDHVDSIEGEQGELLSLLFWLGMILGYYFMFKIIFYFPAKAVGSSISFSESFGMTKGCFWKLVVSYTFSIIGFVSYWLKPIAIWLVCMFVFLAVVIIWLVIGGADPDSIGDILISNPTIEFIQELPFVLYFSPLFVAIISTITSNYYLHAMQNPKDES